MERKVKFVQYGCGKLGSWLIRYAIEKGAELVAAFDMNPALVGKDAGEVTGGEPIGVKISAASDANAIFKELHPDICIIATRSRINELKDVFSVCAKNGVNAITTCEEALFPWNSSPDVSKELDELAKAGGCTFSGSGYPDVYWGTMITNLAGSMVKLTKIKGSSSYNVDDYGIALAEGNGAGLSIAKFINTIGANNALSSEEITELVEKGEYIPTYMWNQNGWLCSRLGLTVISQTQRCEPCTYPGDLYSKTLDTTIKAGFTTGMRAIVTTQTAQGVTLETECVNKVYGPEEFDRNEWTLKGEPDTNVVVTRPSTVRLACATIINRIPQIIDAEPGYVDTEKLEDASFLVKPLNEYVKSK